MHSMRELSGRPLLSTIAWIFVVRPPWLMPIAYFFSPLFLRSPRIFTLRFRRRDEGGQAE
jgi:hypothetical protein